MNKHLLILFLALIFLGPGFSSAQKINREAVVNRHKIILTNADTLASLTVGNGQFAFTVDATGLQSFPEYYAHGVPLGTQSEWGWHSFPNKAGFKFAETLEPYNFNKTNSLYAVQSKNMSERSKRAVDYFRQNPHRLQLGNVGMEIQKKDGSAVTPQDLQDVHQELNLWTGEITSSFKIEGTAVKVITCADAAKDAIAVRISSDLLKEGRIKLKLKFAYPTDQFKDVGTNYSSSSAHQTKLTQSSSTSAIFSRKLDHDSYYVAASWNKKAAIKEVAAHYYTVTPTADASFEATIQFSPTKPVGQLPQFLSVKNSSNNSWEKYWNSGAAIDFAGSTDSRAFELERRVILSQYLERVQCAGHFPPQETGLTYNSWFGKPHMEMYWWHAAHYALWNRPEFLEKSMSWYSDAFAGAAEIAKRQGYKGVRWQKMTDHEGGEAPSSIGSFLIWQQPHVIYLAELLYRNHPSKTVLQKYQKLIFATADFMASFAQFDKTNNRYNLGKGIIPAQECYDPATTFNSPYELAYWKWALQTAQNWRTKSGLEPDKNWQNVIDKIAPLAQKDGVYKAAESVEDSYSPESKYTIDHPAVLAALSTLPQQNGFVDTAVMRCTYNLIGKVWHWDHTWGWDFPMIAMTATRLNQPEAAIDMLFKNVTTNTYLVNGHNYQDKRLTIYLPGNGSLLAAIALMCAGYDGNKIPNPGFPKNGKWKVKWEGFKPLP
jgi:hypothetical protein